jgi:hypothetical protein
MVSFTYIIWTKSQVGSTQYLIIKDQFTLINDGVKKGVDFPFNVIDTYKSLNFQKETSLGILRWTTIGENNCN